MELSEKRIDALLRGRVPVSNSALAAAYLTSYVHIATTDDCAGTANSELQTGEISSMIRHGSNPRRLALQMLGSMSNGGDAGASAFVMVTQADAGFAQTLLDVTDELLTSVQRHLVSGTTTLPANLLDDLDCASRSVYLLLEKDIYKACAALSHSALHLLGTLSSKAARVAADSLLKAHAFLETSDSDSSPRSVVSVPKGDSLERNSGKPLVWGSAPSEAQSAALLIRAAAKAFIPSNGHVNDESDRILLKAISEDKEAMGRHLTAIALSPCTTMARYIASFLSNTIEAMAVADSSISKDWLAAYLLSCQQMIDIISSTSHDEATSEFIMLIITVLLQIAPQAPTQFIAAGALSYLQPLLVCKHSVVVITACRATAILSVHESAQEPERSDSIQLIKNVLRSILPGELVGTNEYTIQMLSLIADILTNTSAPHLQLAQLHLLCCDFTDEPLLVNKATALALPKFLTALRVCAASKDAFIFTAAAYLLKQLQLAVPFYKEHGTEETDLSCSSVEKWTIEQVCKWVDQQPFRMHKAAFRDSLISGEILVEISDADLVSVGVENPLHRRSILHAVRNLKAIAATPLHTAAGSTEIARTLAHAQAAKEEGVDVFLSYRRDGGSDFAQLLKIVLTEAGLNVFLDVENLGGGVFDDKLWSTLQKAKTCCLVWSKGVFDRMLREDPLTSNDFVRKEYVLALQLGLHIVPVRHENFEFPNKDLLPEDVRKVLSYNAVPWSGAYREASARRLIEQLGYGDKMPAKRKP